MPGALAEFLRRRRSPHRDEAERRRIPWHAKLREQPPLRQTGERLLRDAVLFPSKLRLLQRLAVRLVEAVHDAGLIVHLEGPRPGAERLGIPGFRGQELSPFEGSPPHQANLAEQLLPTRIFTASAGLTEAIDLLYRRPRINWCLSSFCTR